MTAGEEGQASLQREVFQERGANTGTEKLADQPASPDQDLGQKSLFHNHQSGLEKVVEDGVNSRVHIQDRSLRALRVPPPPNRDHDHHQTRRRG